MLLKSAGSFAPHTPAPLRGFLWREGGSPYTSANPSSGISRADVSFDMMARALPPA